MDKTIICAMCGKEIVRAGRSQKYCLDCREEAYKLKKTENKRLKRLAAKAPKSNHAELSRIEREGRELGLHYGQMVALGGR